MKLYDISYRISINRNSLFSIIFLYFVFFSIPNLYAQSDTIELKKYPDLDKINLKKFYVPDFKYKSLMGIFDLSGNYNANRFYILSNNDLKSVYSGNLEFSYFNNVVSRKKVKSTWVNFQINYYKDIFLKRINSNEKSYLQIGPQLYYSSTSTFYNKKNLFYRFAYMGNASTSYNRRTFFDTNIDNFKRFYSDLSISPSIAIGLGRVEDVTAAWTAIRILKDLKRENSLTETPDEGRVMQLAKRISEISNKRILDGRIRTKRNFKELDYVIDSLGLVKERNIDYYNSLFDMWKYGINQRRLTNHELTLQLFAIGGINNVSLYNETNPYLIQTGYKLALYYNNYNPLNMFWQFDYGAGLSYYRQYTIISNINNWGLEDILGLSANADLGFFISSRSYLSNGISLKTNYILGQNEDDYFYHEIDYNIFFKYYFSPYNSMKCNFLFLYSKNSAFDVLNGNPKIQYSLTFNHAFF